MSLEISPFWLMGNKLFLALCESRDCPPPILSPSPFPGTVVPAHTGDDQHSASATARRESHQSSRALFLPFYLSGSLPTHSCHWVQPGHLSPSPQPQESPGSAQAALPDTTSWGSPLAATWDNHRLTLFSHLFPDVPSLKRLFHMYSTRVLVSGCWINLSPVTPSSSR